MKTKKFMMISQPPARRRLIEENRNVIEASRQPGVHAEALSGEGRVCGNCRVRSEGDIVDMTMACNTPRIRKMSRILEVIVHRA